MLYKLKRPAFISQLVYIFLNELKIIYVHFFLSSVINCVLFFFVVHRCINAYIAKENNNNKR